MEIAASPKIPGLRLSPVCDTTLQHMRQALGAWSPETHHLFPKAFRETVFLMLLIRQRHSHIGVGGLLDTQVRGGTELVTLPLALPDEIWNVDIMSYLHRDDFREAPPPSLCENCGAPGAVANCPKCHGGRYCDRETCWRAAWQDHKHRCPWFAKQERKKVKAAAKAWAKAGAGSAAEYKAFPPKTRKLADKLLAKRAEAEEGLAVGGDLYTRLVRELRDLENKFEAAPKVVAPLEAVASEHAV